MGSNDGSDDGTVSGWFVVSLFICVLSVVSGTFVDFLVSFVGGGAWVEDATGGGTVDVFLIKRKK